MSTRVYSQMFLAQQGVNGASSTITVPVNHVIVVKQLTFYANPTLGTIRGYFRDLISGATLFSCAASFSLDTGPQPAWFGFYGHLAFVENTSFRWEVSANGTDGADVCVSGFDLINQ